MARSRKRGRRVGSPPGWGALCPDVRRHILSKLSIRQHACAALACREFRVEFFNRVTKERAARISLAEKTIGKAVFNSFVTTVQRVMCGLPSCEELTFKACNDKLATNGEEGDQWIIGACKPCVGRPTPNYLWGGVVSRMPGSRNMVYAGLFIIIWKRRRNSSVVSLGFTPDAGVVARGLNLAICTGNPEATAAHWQKPLSKITLEPKDAKVGPPRNEGEWFNAKLIPSAAQPTSVMRSVYWGPGLDLDGESVRGRRARLRAAARAVATAGKKGWGRHWDGEGLAVCAFLLDYPTTGAGSTAGVRAES